MRVVFLGTPDFALPSLRALGAAGHEIVAVVTRAPKPAGRGRKLRPSAVAALAREEGYPLHEPTRLVGFESVVASLEPQILVVVAYGRILKRPLLEVAPLGVVNVHGSLLPRWRGAAPVARAILAGDEVSGVSIMQLDEGMDTGPVYLTREERIRPDDTTASLSERLALMGAELLVEALAGIESGELEACPQPDEGVTLAPPLEADEGLLDWRAPVGSIERRVRAMFPWPAAFTTLGGRRLRVLAARPLSDTEGSEPGRVAQVTREGFVVSCGRGSLLVLRAQVEGRAACSARDLVNGRVVGLGAVLGG